MGPILFLLYVNDIPSVVDSHLLLFADDIKLYRRIQSENDIIQLQKDIDDLLNWSNTWLLNFNIPKCKVLRIGTSILHQNYTLNGTPLDNVQDMRDLGVIIDSKLNFHSHSTHTVSKANRLLGLIRKSFENISIQTLPMLYKSLVRPTLEYGNPIWGPYYVLDQQAVERVQRRATKMIQPLRDLPYHTDTSPPAQLAISYLPTKKGRYDYNLSNNPPSTQHSFSRLLHSFIVY